MYCGHLPLYRPQRSCGQGNIFTLVCHFVQGGSPGENPPRPQTLLRLETPPDQPNTLPGTRPPQHQADTPRTRQTPPWTRQTPPRTKQTPLPQDQADTPRTRQTPPQTRQTPPTQDQADTPPGSRHQHMVNERPVRILLEFILVIICEWPSLSDGLFWFL